MALNTLGTLSTGTYPPPCRWVMVVMELLEGAVTWQKSIWQRPTDMLREAVKKLHGAGWVHRTGGGIRGANVLTYSSPTRGKLSRRVFLIGCSLIMFHDSVPTSLHPMRSCPMIQ